MAWIDRLREAEEHLDQPYVDPWLRILERALQGVEAASSVAILDMVGARPTSANGRRLAPLMRQLGYIAIKSRRLLPGGFKDNITRGWAKPVRGQSPLPLHQHQQPQGKKVKP
jgi:hypothetical protein